MAVGFILGVGLIILDETVRHWLWLWVKKVIESTVFKTIFMIQWMILNLGLLVYHSWHFIYVRDNMFSTPQDAEQGRNWDFGQVVAVLLWVPAAYQLILALVVTIKPPRDEGIVCGFANILYRIAESLCKQTITQLIRGSRLILSR